MLLKESSYEVKPYMYTAVLENGVTIQAFEDGTAIGDDGNSYRLISHIDSCEFFDVFDEVVVDGWELVSEK